MAEPFILATCLGFPALLTPARQCDATAHAAAHATLQSYYLPAHVMSAGHLPAYTPPLILPCCPITTSCLLRSGWSELLAIPSLLAQGADGAGVLMAGSGTARCMAVSMLRVTLGVCRPAHTMRVLAQQ